jgi:hypothetical protein
MKTKEQLYMEARDHLEKKIEKLQEEKIRLDNEIQKSRDLLKELPRIYDSN